MDLEPCTREAGWKWMAQGELGTLNQCCPGQDPIEHESAVKQGAALS